MKMANGDSEIVRKNNESAAKYLPKARESFLARHDEFIQRMGGPEIHDRFLAPIMEHLVIQHEENTLERLFQNFDIDAELF
jgi:hypothetical protein